MKLYLGDIYGLKLYIKNKEKKRTKDFDNTIDYLANNELLQLFKSSNFLSILKLTKK